MGGEPKPVESKKDSFGGSGFNTNPIVQPKQTTSSTTKPATTVIPVVDKKEATPSASDNYDDDGFDIVESIANLGDQMDDSNKNKNKGGFDEANLDDFFNKKDKKNASIKASTKDKNDFKLPTDKESDPSAAAFDDDYDFF